MFTQKFENVFEKNFPAIKSLTNERIAREAEQKRQRAKLHDTITQEYCDTFNFPDYVVVDARRGGITLGNNRILDVAMGNSWDKHRETGEIPVYIDFSVPMRSITSYSYTNVDHFNDSDREFLKNSVEVYKGLIYILEFVNDKERMDKLVQMVRDIYTKYENFFDDVNNDGLWDRIEALRKEIVNEVQNLVAIGDSLGNNGNFIHISKFERNSPLTVKNSTDKNIIIGGIEKNVGETTARIPWDEFNKNLADKAATRLNNEMGF